MARTPIEVETQTHAGARRRNIPTAELQALVAPPDAAPKPVRYPRETPLPKGERRPRNPDLDPQLVWRGKDEQDWSDLIVQAPPLYVQEKVHPKAIIADLLRRSKERRGEATSAQFDFYSDFNGLPDYEAKLEFYAHDQNWSNRFILGDSLQVMASLAEKEALRGKVQCIYFDPPYGIKFNSNWQISTGSNEVKDGKSNQISREPEQVKAFRDTWHNGINSYLTYLRDRLSIVRDLLHDSGSVFLQIGDENVHRVRALMEDVFGSENYISSILYRTTGGLATKSLSRIGDNILWFARNIEAVKVRHLYLEKSHIEDLNYRMLQDRDFTVFPISKRQQDGKEPLPETARLFRYDNATGQGSSGKETPLYLHGKRFDPPKNTHWKANYPVGMQRLTRANRLAGGGSTISYKRLFDDYSVKPLTSVWMDTGVSGFAADKLYVVQTLPDVIQRCILMASDPGDLVLDPTCGSGTTATVAEQWGRRWITIDTSRVALALARSRVMGARYPYYLLADSPEGQRKEAEVTRATPRDTPTHGDIRHGFVCERVPHITLKSIANNTEIDVIWDKWQLVLEPIRAGLNTALGQSWEEWQIPREPGDRWPDEAARTFAALRACDQQSAEAKSLLHQLNKQLDGRFTHATLPATPRDPWAEETTELHGNWWKARIARQTEIDASIAARAEFETLHDKPYTDPGRVRVAGPFTVESLSPHRVVPADDDELWDDVAAAQAAEPGRPVPRRTRPSREKTDFSQVVLDHLRTSGVHQAKKQDRITFTSLTPWPGTYIAAEARFQEGSTERRAGIFIGPEFGTVARPDMVAAAREAADAGFTLLIACAFNYDAHASEFAKLGPVQVIRARMNPDLHMANDLKNTGSGNLFVVFGEPDLEIKTLADGQLRVRVAGLDIFDPSKGEVRAGGTDDIAAWFIDTDYDEESFFIRHAYFLGANDPYKALKTTLKAEIDEEAWATLYRDESRPFPRPSRGRIAVKVINHFGDEVMKVFSV